MRVGRYLVAAALSALLATPVVAQTASPSTSTSHPSATTGRHGTTRTQPQTGAVDINSASAQELDKLPGIGKARAQAIIAHRPFKSTSELVDRKVIPQNVYNQIKDKIVAHQSTAVGSGSSRRPSDTAKKSK
jgi:DNA uptake protein ComE-like DNA-binding protein